MKTAIYIEDGLVQLVLTPKGEFEKNALSSFEGKELAAEIHSGSFYTCQGGWVRHSHDDKSLMVTIRKESNNERTG